MKPLSLYILMLLFLLNISMANGQPKARKNPKNGQFEDEMQIKPAIGQTNIHPLTTFIEGGTTIEAVGGKINAIIATIPNNSQTFSLLNKKLIESIVDDAINTDKHVSAESAPEKIAPSASSSKNCAFMYLLGIDKTGGDIKGTPTHEAYRDFAISMLKDCYINTPFLSFGGTRVIRFINRCKDLTMYLQSYDLLLAARRLEVEGANASYKIVEKDADMEEIKLRLQYFPATFTLKATMQENFLGGTTTFR